MTPQEWGVGFYFGVRILRNKKPRLLYVYAERVTVEGGNLLLWRKKGDDAPQIYRAFAPGAWVEFFAASCIDGDEMAEEHDYDETTGKDARSMGAFHATR